MKIMKNTKIVTAFLKYDYGIKERGNGIEFSYFVPALRNTFSNVIPFWLEENGYPNNSEKLQNKLIDFIDQEKPTIVFFALMKNEISTQTIAHISEKCTTVNWFSDDQWRFDTYTRYLAPLLTYSITVDKYSIPKYNKLGYDNVILSQWASSEIVKQTDLNLIEYKYDISFVGGKNSVREWYINSLKKAGYKVECFGAGWKNGRVSYQQMKEIFINSKINLNLSNSVQFDSRYRRFLVIYFFKNIFSLRFSRIKESLKILGQFLKIIPNAKLVEQLKMRNFEIPACGGFQLSHYAPGVEDYFYIGKEIIVFANLDDLKNQIRYYLHNDLQRENIRNAGYNRSTTFTYENRFKKIFKTILS